MIINTGRNMKDVMDNPKPSDLKEIQRLLTYIPESKPLIDSGLLGSDRHLKTTEQIWNSDFMDYK